MKKILNDLFLIELIDDIYSTEVGYIDDLDIDEDRNFLELKLLEEEKLLLVKPLEE